MDGDSNEDFIDWFLSKYCGSESDNGSSLPEAIRTLQLVLNTHYAILNSGARGLIEIGIENALELAKVALGFREVGLDEIAMQIDSVAKLFPSNQITSDENEREGILCKYFD